MSKFNLNQLLLNGGAKGGGGETRPDAQGYKITHIPISSLEPSKDNFYDTTQIEELKASIAAFGVKQNLVVTPTGAGMYRVIAGHRRRLACISLVEDGKMEFETVPCIIESEADELRERLLLITTNSTTRQLSDWEKIMQAQELKGLLEQIKKRDKIPGRLRELVASSLDVSTAQVGRMEAIAKNLTPEFKEELKEGRVNMSTAYEVSGLPEDQQKEAFADYQERGSISIKDAKGIKQDIKPEEKPPESQENGSMEDEGDAGENETVVHEDQSEEAEDAEAEPAPMPVKIEEEESIAPADNSSASKINEKAETMQRRFDTPNEHPRETVLWFAQKMEERLRKNENKGGWGPDNCSMNYLLEQMDLKCRQVVGSHGSGLTSKQLIALLADVANYAMMQADRLMPIEEDQK